MSFILPSELRGTDLPARVLELPDPPEQLFLWGELPSGPAVAIVGTRRPTPGAAAFARRLARELATSGVVVYSGGALGIDTEAHQGALRAGGTTVVVGPAGLERPYPPENADLFRQVLARGGAYLSARAPDQPATLAAFFQRNAVLASLAHLVVMVEAPVRSGARNTASRARELGRPLLVVPSAPWNLRGRGCILELRLGARVLLSHRDVLDALAEAGPRLRAPELLRDGSDRMERNLQCHGRRTRRRRQVRPAEKTRDRLAVSRPIDEALDTPELGSVLQAVQAGAQSADELSVVLRLPVKLVQHSLLLLTLRGKVVMDGAGRVWPVPSW